MTAPESVTIHLPKGALAGWPVLIHALRTAEKKTGLHLVFGGLIEQIEKQTTPKPAEPTGLGAVVEDADGKRWVRGPSGPHSWVTDVEHSALWFAYSEINVVRVLSEGVTA